ncbi:site-specific integrase [Paenibacillus cremeus]|nr:site-specific integrase [Paenibacillus cremeus]
MKEALLSDIIQKTREEVQAFEYRCSTMKHYERYWKDLSNHFARHEAKMYSDQLVDQYVSDMKNQLDTGFISNSKYKNVRRAVYLLKDYVNGGSLHWRRMQKPCQRITRPEWIQILACYARHLQKNLKSVGTIRTYRRIAEQFIEYLELKGSPEVSEITPKDVSSFFPHISIRYPKGLHVVLPTIRSFLTFLEVEKLAAPRLSWAVPQYCHRTIPPVSIVTNEEVKKLLQTINRNTPVGKRDYAVLLLAARTGLRRTDISKIRLCDINWRNNSIEVIQEKTETPVALPLLTDVGNAVADYILNARPKSESPYVFLRHCAPYLQMSSAVCYEVTRKAMDRAHIHQNEGERKGPHCLRHAVASQLLEKETPLSVISTILGHKNKNSTKVYLSTDVKKLRFCALGLTGIEVAREELK